MPYDLPPTNPILPDDEQAKEVEARMRRSLGLNATTGNGSTPPLPNDPLKAARQAIRSQATAREHAERQLAQAQAVIHDLRTKLHHTRLDKDVAQEAARVATAAKITAERTLIATESALAAEKAGRERGERSLRDAHATIRELQGKLDAAVQGLQAVQAELAAERQARHTAEEIARAAVTTTPAEVQGEAAPVVRRPVGRPRKNIVAQPRGRKASAKAPAPRKAVPKKPVSRKQSPVPTVRRPVGRPRKKLVAQSAQRPAKSSARAAAPTKTAPKKVGKPAKKVTAKAGRPVQARKPKPIKSWRNGR
jgi:hypothetical protein